MSWEIREGDALERLREMPDESVQTCITSPPYFGLRDYGHDGQIGLEATPDAYVAALVGVFGEVRRVLRDDGTLWLNLGDSYAGSWGSQGHRETPGTISRNQIRNHPKRASHTGTIRQAGVKPKDLLGIPWMVAFALRSDGWYLRSEIVWHKPNPMPESVTDRPTRSHEQVFLLSKSPRYFYDADAIREADLGTDHVRTGAGRNKRSVWTVATQPYAAAHFATFPPKLVEPMVLAGSAPQACGECGAPWERVVERTSMEVRPGPTTLERQASANGGVSSRSRSGTMTKAPTSTTTGWESSCAHGDGSGSSVVLDPFAGAGTVALPSLRHDRSFIGIELSPEYCELARQRIRDDAPLMNTASEVAA